MPNPPPPPPPPPPPNVPLPARALSSVDTNYNISIRDTHSTFRLTFLLGRRPSFLKPRRRSWRGHLFPPPPTFTRARESSWLELVRALLLHLTDKRMSQGRKGISKQASKQASKRVSKPVALTARFYTRTLSTATTTLQTNAAKSFRCLALLL